MPVNNRFRLNPKTYEHLPTPNVIGNNSEMSHIYYNLQIFNSTNNYDNEGNPIQTLLAVPADFSQQRANDFILKPSDYTATVTYFHLDSNSFPSQVVQPIVGQSYQNKQVSPSGFEIEGFPTIYAFTVEANWYTLGLSGPLLNTKTATANIQWTPLDSTLPKPQSPINNRDIQNEYFWNYSFDYFLDLLNNSIAYQMDLLSSTEGLTTQYPYFYHDGKTDLISMDTPLSFQTDSKGELVNLDDTVLNKISWKIYVNEPLYQLLSSLSFIYEQTPSFYGYQLLSVVKPDTSNIIIQSGSNYIKSTQEYPSAPLWNPCVSVVFTTPNFNVVNEMNAKPYIDGFNPVPQSNNAGTLNILFEYFLGRRADPTINNFVRAEYRLTDLLGVQPQSELIVKTYWKDEFGILHPFFIEQGSGMNMKILFRKKIFN